MKINEPLTVFIADDENLARRELKRLLKRLDGIDMIGEASNGLEALDKITNIKPDLALLDIEMPGLSGLQVAEKLAGAAARTDVIIVTAYDHYAVKAFEIHAVDYVLKPIEPERLSAAVERVRCRVAAGTRAENVDKLLSALNSGKKKKLAIRAGSSSIIINDEDVIFAYIDNGVVNAVTADRTGPLNCRSLDELEELLGKGFLRTHRKYMVNIDKIEEVISWFSGTYRLRLKNNSEIPLSRNQAKELKKILDF